MGQWLKIFLESQGLTVTVSGSSNPFSDPIAQADIVFFSVPISVASEAIKGAAEIVKKDSLLVDLSSIQGETAVVLQETGLSSAVVHFLFGPTITTLQNQKIIFYSIKNNKLIGRLNKMFEDSGAEIIKMAPEEHDLQMAHIQALTHFTNLALGSALIKGKIDLSGKVSTPVFLAQMGALSRVISQSPKLLSEIQLGNPLYIDVLESFIDYQGKLLKIIKAKDFKKLETEIEKIHQVLESSPRKISVKKPVKESISFNRLPAKFKIAFLGPIGTFSHQATLLLTEEGKQVLMPCRTLYEIFGAVSSGLVDLGVVPAENSMEGTIRETLDFLVDFDLKINLGFNLTVHQNLLSNSKELKKIKRVISHPQALAQSREWLLENLPGAKIEAASSTLAGIGELEDLSVAIIGPLVAAKLYKLNIIAKDIENNHQNITRFYIISKSLKSFNKRSNKTLIYLTVFNQVGILRDILDIFAGQNINLSKLESRPSREKVWDYSFFLEVEANMEDSRLVQALNILKQYCPVIKVLGGE